MVGNLRHLLESHLRSTPISLAMKLAALRVHLCLYWSLMVLLTLLSHITEGMELVESFRQYRIGSLAGLPETSAQILRLPIKAMG